MKTCLFFWLGELTYPLAWDIQKKIAAQRGQNTIEDTLLLLEHSHVYTFGSAGRPEHLLINEAECRERGISIHKVDRGGDITYHGPGQLVGYPVLLLESNQTTLRTDVVAYIRQLEEVLILALERFGLKGERLAGLTGVWVQTPIGWEKIAAIGVKVTARRVTLHGFALNINTDLHYFTLIVPCGIRDKAVTSMQALLGHPVDSAAVRNAVIEAFSMVFQRTMHEEKPIFLASEFTFTPYGA